MQNRETPPLPGLPHSKAREIHSPSPKVFLSTYVTDDLLLFVCTLSLFLFSTVHRPHTLSNPPLSLHFQTLNSQIQFNSHPLPTSPLKFPKKNPPPFPLLPFQSLLPLFSVSYSTFLYWVSPSHTMNATGRQISRSNPAVHHQRQHSDTAFDALCSYGRWAQPSNLSHVHYRLFGCFFLLPFLV